VYTWEIKSKVMGFVGTEVAAAIVQALELPISPDEYLDMAQSVVHRMFPSCKILPGQLDE
jgi:pseudouridine-5'-monophosphatase